MADKKDKKDVARTLRMAAQLIAEHGWCQNSLGNYYEGFCAIGAIIESTEDEGTAYSAEGALEAHLGRRVVNWNDNVAQTSAEVIHALMSAADRVGE